MFWNLYKAEIEAKVKSHWITYNSQRLDFADGTQPETNPINFHFYCNLNHTGENISEVEVKFQPAHEVSPAETVFYDGLVYIDQDGRVLVRWESEHTEQKTLAAMAEDLHNNTGGQITRRRAVYDLDDGALDEYAA